MDVKVVVETKFVDGETRSHELGLIYSSPKQIGPESLGLLEEAKTLLKRLWNGVIRD